MKVALALAAGFAAGFYAAITSKVIAARLAEQLDAHPATAPAEPWTLTPEEQAVVDRMRSMGIKVGGP